MNIPGIAVIKRGHFNQGELMTNDNRVLSRRGARVLTPEELEVIAGSGGPIGCTQVCTNRPTEAGMGFQCDSECPKPH